jgi:predicted glycogen debranching enzyme
MIINIDRETCGSLEEGLSREWLETNGIGGFASSTLSCANTRRYHGLLTAALNPPVDRFVLLSKMEETVFLNGEKYELSTNLYPSIVHPEGYRHLVGFRLDPFPIFTYDVAGVKIEKRIFMVHGENTTVIEYAVLGESSCTLELRPLIAFRDYHSTTRANDALNGAVELTPGQAHLTPYEGMPSLWLAHNARFTQHDGHWYYNFEYPQERERGLDYQEDLYQPFMMQFDLGPEPARVIAALKPHDVSAVDRLRSEEIARRAELGATFNSTASLAGDFAASLASAADQFIVRRGESLHTVIAGYHWFSDWGRDTMIALPGLTLATGRPDLARDILVAFANAADMGMLPNRFPDAGETPEYNTVDASLWFFEAIRKYLSYTSNYAFVRENLYATMTNIIDWHLMGTRYGIKCGEDGLISTGGPGTQLTWMDAKVGDFVATPRHGKPVEIQALWYNALRVTHTLAARFEDNEVVKLIASIAPQTLTSFNNLFWNADANCLYDVIRDDYKDPAIRPNQVLALSLGYTMVATDRAKQILNVVERELLTEFGLRTLAPSDSQYQPQCNGSQIQRDSAYHQGTIWPWLIGPFITAYLRFYPDERSKARTWLNAFPEHLRTAGIGSISEILDAAPPHTSRGCIAQAWSVGEVLRVLVEDLPAVRTATA